MNALRQVVTRVRRWARQRACAVLLGGHELYPARASGRFFQSCLLCGYETTGWALEPSPRLRRRLAGRPQQRRQVLYLRRRSGGRR